MPESESLGSPFTGYTETLTCRECGFKFAGNVGMVLCPHCAHPSWAELRRIADLAVDVAAQGAAARKKRGKAEEGSDG